MIADVKYKNLDQVMRGLYKQIADSYQYCADNFPKFENPVEMWRYVKPLLTFRHDPTEGDLNHQTGQVYDEETELLQTAQTLFDNNIHGESGYGDCDCFSALAIAIFHTQGWNNCDIVLAGRNKKEAVHIYTYVTFEGETYCIDFTQPRFNSERYYPYTQVIPVTFKSTDMARLQLAENYMNLSEGVADLYITIPDGRGGTMKVREDYFDEWDETAYNTLMELVEPLNTPMHMNGILSKWRERHKAKREERRTFKLTKQKDKFAGRESVAKAGGGFAGIGTALKGIFGGSQQDEMLPPGDAAAPTTRDFSLQVGKDLPGMPGGFWANNKQWIIPVGIGVGVLGATLLITRKKS